MKKYGSYIQSINECIKEYSAHLKEEYRIPAITNEILNDSNTCVSLVEEDWKNFKFPNCGHQGVYFLFGENENREAGVYVGKTSHNNDFGRRLDNHLNNPKREQRIYPKVDGNGIIYNIDFAITIPFYHLYFFASSFEEYLIYNLPAKKVYLLNTLGFKNKYDAN